jgi:sporulation protein YlmC with PRC-barrel domain
MSTTTPNKECRMRCAERLAVVAVVFLIAAGATSLATTQAVGQITVGAPVSTAPEVALVGRRVYAAEGKQVGHIDSVETDGDGQIVTIDVTLGNTLALGPKTVRVPGDKIIRTGLKVRLAMSTEEISVLPSIDSDPD